ncbi:hypothetical protein Fot_48956 [Forsythia ovata]|uniref:Uncharacterized protein n=1 Tax=Forsythia ovata TaxID=205694 RepID=A0ABD1QAI6_9LAMI
MKKQNDGENSGTLPVEKPISSRYRETLFEIADYGFGRRSCDIDSRFSLDARTRRINFDDPRMSSMVSVMEDAPAVNVAVDLKYFIVATRRWMMFSVHESK